MSNDITQAIRYHQAGKLDRADQIYRRILDEDPDSVDALHFSGMLAYQKGEAGKAVKRLQRALELNPGYADAHNNLGNMLIELGDINNARQCYENALACDPERLETHNNLGVLLRHTGDLKASLSHLERATSMAPEWAHAHFNLGRTCAELGQRDRATEHYLHAMELDPEIREFRPVICHYLTASGYPELARDIYKRWLESEPDNPVAQHMLAALDSSAPPSRASDRYIAHTFDAFARSFEYQLERLGYRAPQLIADEIRRRAGEPGRSLETLDLGCGTGLCGPLVRPFASTLTGVDLSTEMLRRCSQGKQYDRLHRMELVAFLEKTHQTFDLLISADTLVYFGDLHRAIQAMAARMNPGARVVFTVEQNTESDAPYVIYHHGRYGHSKNYMREELADAGLSVVEVGDCVLRRESGKPVKGWLVSAEKKAPGS